MLQPPEGPNTYVITEIREMPQGRTATHVAVCALVHAGRATGMTVWLWIVRLDRLDPERQERAYRYSMEVLRTLGYRGEESMDTVSCYRALLGARVGLVVEHAHPHTVSHRHQRVTPAALADIPALQALWAPRPLVYADNYGPGFPLRIGTEIVRSVTADAVVVEIPADAVTAVRSGSDDDDSITSYHVVLPVRS